ncbi:AT-hook motif nuclear-localized protein 10-like protein [Drosera capensis]
MDRHDPTAPPQHHHHFHHNHHNHQHQHQHHQQLPHNLSTTTAQHHHPHHHQTQQQQSTLMIPTNPPPQVIMPISSSSSPNIPTSRYLFNSTQQHHQEQQQHLQEQPFKVEAGGLSIGDSGGVGDQGGKKKRGRPRKYEPDGGSNVALRLAPAPVSGDLGTVAGEGEAGETPEGQGKKHRGRPPGSGKKQLDALGNCGVGFTPHVILVEAGEDIGSKILAFSQQGPRTVCILSANGSISNVTLRQPATSAGTVTYEGKFDIISLSGSFLLSENDHVKTGGLSISIAGTDGRVLGGGIAGILRAATPVQIVVGSFIADGKKPKYMPSVPESRMLSFSAHAPADSPASHEASGGSSDNDGDSPIDENMGGPSPYNNFNQQGHNVHMYQGWANSNLKMDPH